MPDELEFSDLVTWTEDISVGLEEIDSQHMFLIEGINQLWRALGENRENDIILDLIQRLYRYAESHFADEEMLMRAFDYPHLEAHKEAHRKFVERVRSAADEYSAGKMIGMELLRFLSDYLLRHISVEDRDYAYFVYLKRRGRFRGTISAFLRSMGGAKKGQGNESMKIALQGLDMKQVIAVHMEWNRRLESFLSDEGAAVTAGDRGRHNARVSAPTCQGYSGKLDPGEVARDDLCMLGNWIKVNVPTGLDRLREFVTLRESHAAFHHCAAKIVTVGQQQDREGAKKLLRGEFRPLSNTLKLDIVQLYAAHKQGSSGSPPSD